ncbi:response regulator transcription factor [Sulfurimonas sp. SWIR-19]|uniref:response regulator transcription factor n=1 Tax=Sulfurimonas sp. SWIR-19 TaxID=2878390 RepID=UPI001CF5B579|nr:response regulator transcription factor [Sulfurimonas sp. SWIR-19]UCN00245.1 response regulator transcription factor [Sulfurimonas sp. SWIR-19]
MRKSKILLVEDDELSSELVFEYLSDCGFFVEPVFTATDGVAKVKNEPFDLVLLDINLPDFDGFEVLKSLKNHTSVPIIVTSAYSDTQKKLLAFKYGASDYMTKPLDLEELEARIWLQLGKNSAIKTEDEKKIFEIKNNHVYFQQKQLDLTTIEFELLSLLIKNKNSVMRREELVNALSSISSHRSLDNHIKNIRKKIGDTGTKAQYLKTEYGVGYKLTF